MVKIALQHASIDFKIEIRFNNTTHYVDTLLTHDQIRLSNIADYLHTL